MHRALDPDLEWSFFDDDFRVPVSDRVLVRALSIETATALWESEVAPSPLHRHPMFLPDGHWLEPQKVGPAWLDEWQRGEGGQVEGFIRSVLQSHDDEIAHFIYMREDAYEAPVRVITEHWRAWLALDDEGPFVLMPMRGTYVGFGPNGCVFGGCRR